MRLTPKAISTAFILTATASTLPNASASTLDQYGTYIRVGLNSFVDPSVYYQTNNSGPVGGPTHDSFDSGTVTYYEYTDTQSGDLISLSGSASASADLRTGQIRVGALCGYNWAQSCVSEGSLVDTLLFDASGLQSNDPIEIGFAVRVDGTFSNISQTNFSFLLSGMSDTKFASVRYLTPNNNTDLFGSTADGSLGVFEKIGEFDVFSPSLFSGSFTIDPTRVDTSLPIAIYLQMGLGGGAPTNFTHTAAISLRSPVPYTSASGVFLSEISVSAVPVPGALPLLATGLAGFGLLARRRRNAQAVDT